MVASVFDSLGLTDVIILAGIAGYLVERFIDARGWSRSSKTLRQENQDLVRRNTELEATVQRHELELTRLRALVDDLQSRDQAAVLKAIELHEANAAARNAHQETRHEVTAGLLREIRDRLPKETT